MALGIAEEQHRLAPRAKLNALIDARQKARAPQARARAARRPGEQHDVGRQIAVLRAEPVGHPRAEARPTAAPEAGVQEHLRRRVIDLLGVQRLHDGDVVGDGRQVRQQLREHLPALPVRRELELRAGERHLARR